MEGGNMRSRLGNMTSRECLNDFIISNLRFFLLLPIECCARCGILVFIRRIRLKLGDLSKARTRESCRKYLP